MGNTFEREQLQRGFKFDIPEKLYLLPEENEQLFKSKLEFYNCTPLHLDKGESAFYRHPQSPILDVIDNFVKPIHLLSSMGYYSIGVKDDNGVEHHLIDRSAVSEASVKSSYRRVESNVDGEVIVRYKSLLKHSPPPEVMETGMRVIRGEQLVDSFIVQPLNSNEGIIDIIVENVNTIEKAPAVVKLNKCPNILVLEPTQRSINKDILEKLAVHYNTFNSVFSREQLVALLLLVRSTQKYLSRSIEQNVTSLIEEFDFGECALEIISIKTNYLVSTIFQTYIMKSRVEESGYLRLEVTPDSALVLGGPKFGKRATTTGDISVRIDNVSSANNSLIVQDSLRPKDGNGKTLIFSMPMDSRISVTWESPSEKLTFSSMHTLRKNEEVALGLIVEPDIYDSSVRCMLAEITCGDIREIVRPKIN